jgi:hypothetical protein
MNMKRNSNLLQSGQAILVIALAMVGLIGALGLAVDGGGLAFLYRDAQNAADSAALAAAYARCTGGDLNIAALTVAEENGFDNSGTSNWVTVQSPVPAASLPAGDIDRDVNNYVSVTVRAIKQAYFIQILYPQGLEATASATAHCTPAVTTEAGAGFAMVGLGPQGGISLNCHTNNGICEPIEGRRLNVQGNVVSGGRNARWLGDVSVSGTTVRYDNPPNPLASLQLSQFRDGGAVWNRVDPNLRFEYSQSEWNTAARPENRANLHGLYFVNGDANIDGNIPNAVTIVATGKIRITNSNAGLTAFVDDILAFSGKDNGNACDSNTVVYIRGSGNSRGIVYGPMGQVEILWNAGSWDGALVGKWVDWWPDGSEASTLRALPLTTPPAVALVS